MPSKSKLDRNPPKKKSNPELLANGSDDSVFNATAAKQTNQDGQFLMNNVEEGKGLWMNVASHFNFINNIRHLHCKKQFSNLSSR